MDLTGLENDERVFVLRLPSEGVLPELLQRGAKVSLGWELPKDSTTPKTDDPQKAQKAQKASDPLNAAPPSKFVPAEVTTVIQHARILDKTSKLQFEGNKYVTACYAVIAVKDTDMKPLITAPGNIWVWIEGHTR